MAESRKPRLRRQEGTDPSSGAHPEPISRRPDATDLAILRELTRDGRMSINQLAHRVNLSRTNAYARVARLRDERVIEAFTVRVDPKKAGLPVAALVAVNVEQKDWRLLRQKLVAFDEIEYFAFTTGEFDLVLLVRAPDNDTLRDVILERLSAIEGVRTTTTFVILDDGWAPSHSG